MPATEVYGFLRGRGDAHFLPTVFLELGGENAVFPQGAAASLQLTAHAGVEIVAVDNQLQVATWLGKGAAQPEQLMIKVPLLPVIEYVEFRGGQPDEGLLINLSVEGLYEPPVQLIYVIQQTEGHVPVYRGLMLYQYQAGIAKAHGDVVLDAAEEAAVQRIEPDYLRALIAGAPQCIPQGQQPAVGSSLAASAIEVVPENRISYLCISHNHSLSIISKNGKN